MTCGRPFLCDTCSRPSKLLGMVTQFSWLPGNFNWRSKVSKAFFCFFNFFTNASTAFSAHLSSSSPCFQFKSFLTCGEFTLRRLDMVLTTDSILMPWCFREFFELLIFSWRCVVHCTCYSLLFFKGTATQQQLENSSARTPHDSPGGEIFWIEITLHALSKHD